jgi:hypothetical protein
LIFQLGQVCVSGLPRTPHPSAAPATNLRVAPNLQSIGCAGGGSSGRPESRFLPRCRFPSSSGLPLRPTSSATPPMSPRVAPVSASPALPAMEFRVASNLASFGGADWPIPRVAPLLQSLGIADDQSPGCPESCILRHRLICLRVASDYAPSGCASGESPGLPESSYPPATSAESTSESPRIFIPLAAQTELTSRLP